MTTHVFTSAALNYLPKVRVLFNSLKRLHPEWVLHLWLIEEKTTLYFPDADSVHTIEELNIHDWRSWAFGHTLVELATAVKPFILKKLLVDQKATNVLYFDPDIVVFSRLDEIIQELKSSSIVLTPHITTPEQEIKKVVDNEICSLKHGVYNLGFFGVSSSDIGHSFADWWSTRLYYFCMDNIPEGLFTDQRWIDLVPAMFDGVKILKSCRFNVASWNLSSRKISENDKGEFLVNGLPLGFYHFTGFDSGAHKISANSNSNNNPFVLNLLNWYTAKLSENKCEKKPWTLGVFSDGSLIKIEYRKQHRFSSSGVKHKDPYSYAPTEALHKLIAEPKLPVILAVNHSWGGGVERHVLDLVSYYSSHYTFLIMSPVISGVVKISAPNIHKSFEIVYDIEQDFEKLVGFLSHLPVSRIHYHHLVGHHPNVKRLVTALGVPYDFTFHDYYSICPQIHLGKGVGIYCEERGADDCAECLRKTPYKDIPIATWRESSCQFLSQASRLIAPCNDVAMRIARYYPNFKITVLPHPEKELLISPPQSPVSYHDRPMKIAIVGRMDKNKGVHVLEECARDSLIRQLPIAFRVIGNTTAPSDLLSNISVSGAYLEGELTGLIREYAPDAIWFPTTTPETFCYALSGAMQSGSMIFSTDLGAIPERLEEYSAKTIYSWKIQANEINDMFMAYYADLKLGLKPKQKVSATTFSIKDFLYVYGGI